MLKKTVTYTNWDGVECTDTFYFNLSRTEVAELEYSVGPGRSLTSMIQEIIGANDMGAILATIKKIVLTAYGEKSEDGKRFVKTPELREAFAQSAAFDEIYMELFSDDEKALDFIVGCIPEKARQDLGEDPKDAVLEKMRSMEAAKKA